MLHTVPLGRVSVIAQLKSAGPAGPALDLNMRLFADRFNGSQSRVHIFLGTCKAQAEPDSSPGEGVLTLVGGGCAMEAAAGQNAVIHLQPIGNLRVVLTDKVQRDDTHPILQTLRAADDCAGNLLLPI